MTQSTSGFTTDEIQTAVQQLVLSSISRPVDTLGVQRSDISFGDIQQAAAGVFVLYPNSPFYVVKLGVGRLQGIITSESLILDQLLSALSALGRQVLPIGDVSPLFNAQAALSNLGAAAAQRGSAYTDITKAPAYQQFAANTAAFLAGPAGAAVKSQGAIVQTPQAAAASIPALLTQVQQAHAATVALVTTLAASIDNYNAVNLPSIVASSVLANSAALLGTNANALNSLTPDQRLATIRTTVLNLLATKAVVNTFGSFSGVSEYYTLDGLGLAFSDAQHAAVPAVIGADKVNGYVILEGSTDQLTLTVDGQSPLTLTLNPSQVATLTTGVDDSSLIIGNGTTPVLAGGVIPNNNTLKLLIAGTQVTATLPVSTTTTATLVGGGDMTNVALYGGGGTLNGKTLEVTFNGAAASCLVTFGGPANEAVAISQINAVINLRGGNATASGIHLLLESTTAGTGGSLSIGNGTANSLLGFTAGQVVTGTVQSQSAAAVAAAIETAVSALGATARPIYFPVMYTGAMDIPAGTNTTWTLSPLGSTDFVALGITTGDSITVASGANAGVFSLLTVTSSTLTVNGTFTAQLGASVTIGPAHRRVQITETDPAVSVPAEASIGVYTDDAPSAACLTLLGWVPTLSSTCALSLADAVAADINAKTGVVTAASNTVVFYGPLATAHANPTNPNLVVLSAAAATGTTTFTGTGPYTVTYAVTAVSTTGPVSTGDTLALRDQAPANGFVITTINGASASNHTLVSGDVVVGTAASNTSTPSSGVVAEFGPTLISTKYQLLTLTGGPNNGVYRIAGMGDTAIDLLLLAPLVQTNSITSPTTGPLVLTATVGDEQLTLTSKNTTTASAVTVTGTAASTFFTTVPATMVGTTPWFKLPALPRGLQPGDILEYYPTNYASPSSVYPILDVNSTLNVLQVDVEESTGLFIPDGSSWQFTAQPVPFARLRYGNMNDFTAVQTLLKAWLANPVNQPLFFENYNRLVNPLLVTTAPTATAIGTAITTLTSLYALLTATEELAVLGTSTASLENIITGLDVEPVTAIDALIQTYTQKGSDRAVDILLTGDFQSFFGLSAEDSSYAGAFQGATRAVAMNDLPVSKMSRQQSTSSQMTVQAQSPDFEYTANAVTEAVQGDPVDPPLTLGSGVPIGYGQNT